MTLLLLLAHGCNVFPVLLEVMKTWRSSSHSQAVNCASWWGTLCYNAQITRHLGPNCSHLELRYQYQAARLASDYMWCLHFHTQELPYFGCYPSGCCYDVLYGMKRISSVYPNLDRVRLYPYFLLHGNILYRTEVIEYVFLHDCT